MAWPLVIKDEQYIVNHCTKYLARDNTDERHNVFGIYDGQERAHLADAWRFPIVDNHDSKETNDYDWNDVTFIWVKSGDIATPQKVELITTCHTLFEPIPLMLVGDSIYMACTLKVRKAQRYRYLFRVDGVLLSDPVNPQMETLLNGESWSSFFTWGYNQPISFERWELTILDRLARHILPFNTLEAKNFLSREVRDAQIAHLDRLDVSAGVANFIDKVVAREERHRLYAYKTCLKMINTVLRKRNPGLEPENIEEHHYTRIYDQLAEGAPALYEDGWDQLRYENPRHFLQLLRRHSMTGAFAHPKYGGNPNGMAWNYLALHFEADRGVSAFAWGQAIEPLLGESKEYRG